MEMVKAKKERKEKENKGGNPRLYVKQNKGGRMKTRVYLLSRTNGTWQIGRTVYQLPTGAMFTTLIPPRKYIRVYEVNELPGWEAVRKAHELDCQAYGRVYDKA